VARPKGSAEGSSYTPEFKLRVVKQAVEGKLNGNEVLKTFGVGPSTWFRWKKLYVEGGEAAILSDGNTPKKSRKKPASAAEAKLREHVLETKQKYPFFGIGRIWTWIRRTIFLPVSYRFVRRTLKEEGLIEPPPKKKRRDPKPKTFERARPNQLWQSDITAFTITKGLRVYLIGFMDDHSRYMVGWGLYAGQSGGLVLEVFRNAIATYGRPEEVLTDNGRQYKSWQGITDFQRELQREGIKHITSRPHHPQTLGKIEGFWGHMKREFLRRVVMGGLEDMRERMGHWMNFYNFQRPHEGIGNSTPAERFFQYSKIAREEIEKRVRRNEKELALLPPQPASLVGRGSLGETPIEVRKEKGEFIVRLGDQVVNRTDLDPRKENGDDSTEGPAGEPGAGGQGGQGEGGDGALDPGGRALDLGGLPGDGPAAPELLQARGADAAVHARDREDAGATGPAEGSAGRVQRAGIGDGGAAPGAPAASEPDAGDPEAGGGPQERPGKAPEGRLDPSGTGDPAPQGGRGGSDGVVGHEVQEES
jgi:transposase InsO family protein